MSFLKSLIGLVISPSHSRTVSIIIVLFILAIVPLTVVVSQQQQEIRQRAAFNVPISIPTPTPSPCIASGGSCIASYPCNLGYDPSALSCGKSNVCCIPIPTPTPTPFDCKDQSGLQFTCVNPDDYDTSSGCPTNWVSSAHNDSPEGTTCSASGRICCWYNPPGSTPTPTPTPLSCVDQRGSGGLWFNCFATDDDCSRNWIPAAQNPNTTCANTPYPVCCWYNPPATPATTPTRTPTQTPTPTKTPALTDQSCNSYGKSCSTGQTCNYITCSGSRCEGTCVPSSPTPTPTLPPGVTPTLTPIVKTTPTLTQVCFNADVDGNGSLDLLDFNAWLSAYQQKVYPKTIKPDINGDREINLLDFNIWFNAIKTNRIEICVEP